MAFNLSAFSTKDTDDMHLMLDGEPCYAPKELDKQGNVISYDMDKPVTIKVYCAHSTHGSRVSREYNRKKDPIEKKIGDRVKTDAEIEELDGMFYAYAAQLIAGWSNIDPEYSPESARDLMKMYPDVAQQVFLHSVRKANYRKK